VKQKCHALLGMRYAFLPIPPGSAYVCVGLTFAPKEKKIFLGRAQSGWNVVFFFFFFFFKKKLSNDVIRSLALTLSFVSGYYRRY